MSLLRLLSLGLLATLAPMTRALDPAEAAGPDLIVTEGHLTLLPDGENFVTREPLRRLSWGHTTENPTKPGAGRAGRSSTAVGLFDKGSGSGNWLHGLRVPVLPPGRTDSNQATFQQNIYMDYGRYWGYICSDIDAQVQEVEEQNNCRWLASRFYVVPRQLSGTVNGRHSPSFTDGTVSWTGTVIFQLRSKQDLNDRGYFYYRPVGGALEFKLRYSNPPCTTTGTATLDARASLEDPFIRLEFREGKYYMFVKPKDFKIPVVASCPGGPPQPGSVPFTGNWLDTGLRGKPFQNPGFTVLDDFYIENSGPGVFRYEWNLEPSG